MKTGFSRFGFLFLVILFAGCAPAADADTPAAPTLVLPAETQTPSPATPNPTIATATSAPVAPSGAAAVILLPEGMPLNIRSAAGDENPVIAEVAANATDLVLTGQTQLSGGETWMEVHTSMGATGWVNARYVTEYIPSERFCSDAQVHVLLDDLKVALENNDGERFADLVSPVHGLDLRYYRYGTLANYTPEEAAWAFQSSYVVNWGDEPGSGLAKEGTFSEIPLPMLQEVFGSAYELFCNDVDITASFAQEPWLPEYANVNFYNVFKPGTEQYGGLDWRAWLVGVEYVGGKPYLFALIHFEWTP